MNRCQLSKPGPCALLHDLGRFGHHGAGYAHGGPADLHAHAWANHLLDNDVNAAVLEFSLGPCELRFSHGAWVSLCGAAEQLHIGGDTHPSWQSLWVPARERLAIPLPRQGLRSYLAVLGGFQVDKMLGSASMVAREGSGPFGGQALRAGCELACLRHSKADGPGPRATPADFRPDYSAPLQLSVLPLPTAECRISQLLGGTWRVDPRSDRMAVRLKETLVDIPEGAGRLSSGTCLGAIQCPPDGRPLILLNDRQSIGGYPHIASVASVDCFTLSQRRPGQTLRFRQGTADEQRERLLRLVDFFALG